MFQINQQRTQVKDRRTHRIRHGRTGWQGGRGMNWYAVYWIAMLAAIVLLWYTIVGMLVEENAIPSLGPAMIHSTPQLAPGRCANLTTSSCIAYVYYLSTPRPAHQAALDRGSRRYRLA